MSEKVIAALPAFVRKHIEAELPEWLEPRWFSGLEQALALGCDAEIGWFDMDGKSDMAAAVMNASGMRWLNSLIAGVDFMPLSTLAERKVVFTNGAGINAVAVAEYVILGVLAVAKGYRDVVRAQDRHEWLRAAPGAVEVFGSKALVFGYGPIGQLVGRQLQGLGVEVTVVRRTPVAVGGAPGTVLGPEQWRGHLGEFDWIILALPATPETDLMLGAAELAAMKSSAVLLNVARGSVVDQEALVAALQSGAIAAAFLDVTEPEPLPADHALWSLPNAHITMHLSGRSQTQAFQRAGRKFLENLARYRAGQALHNQVDLALGY